jgi:hypothetical protein
LETLNVATTNQEAEWRAEFEKLGELVVYDNVRQGSIYSDEEKRKAAFRWLFEQAARRKREVRTLQIVYWTFLRRLRPC